MMMSHNEIWWQRTLKKKCAIVNCGYVKSLSVCDTMSRQLTTETQNLKAALGYQLFTSKSASNFCSEVGYAATNNDILTKKNSRM